MSTRCQIHVEGSTVLIYKHSDGYPEGVIPFLQPFVARFLKLRGKDPEYMAAQIVRHWAVTDFTDREGWSEGKGPATGSDYLGWGLSALADGLHGDEAYIYVVKADGVIEVRRPSSTWPRGRDTHVPTIAHTEIVEKVPLLK